MPAPHDINDALRLCAKYDIPLEDVLMMGINLSGVRYDKEDFARGRFTASPLGAGPFLLALTLNKESRFAHEGDRLTLADITIATASPVENDTCDDTYFRKNGRVITLNSNAKSQCIGCAFCGVYSLKRRERPHFPCAPTRESVGAHHGIAFARPIPHRRHRHRHGLLS